MEKKSILSLPMSGNSIARQHLERGASCWRMSYSGNLKTRNSSKSGSQGPPCHRVWVRGSNKRYFGTGWRFRSRQLCNIIETETVRLGGQWPHTLWQGEALNNVWFTAESMSSEPIAMIADSSASRTASLPHVARCTV
jgi:hypothetical protein